MKGVKIPSAGEEGFALMIQEYGLPEAEREYVFDKSRKWAFDFAWPAFKFAVEIEGLIRTGGRHQRIAGFIADCEKYESALRLGWRVYRVPASWIVKDDRLIWRAKTVDTLREALKCT